MQHLEDRHHEHLRASAIAEEIITARGYRSIPPGSIYAWREIAPATHSDKLLKTVLHEGAIAFPLFRCGEEKPYTWVLRPDLPRTNKQGKPVKYEYPARTPNVLDLLPRYRAALRDPNVPIWMTEGCKKADALASAYGDRIVPINENGVWGWRSKGRVVDDLTQIVWEGRRVILAPDGDVRHNKQVHAATRRTAALLLAHGAAEVLICLLPQEREGPKNGVDDYLAAGHTAEQLESHLVELGAVSESARVSLMKHPTTGTPLFLPAGYDIHNKAIVRQAEGGAQSFYSGLIIVSGIGRNLHTGEESATIAWKNGAGLREATIPRVALSTGTGCAKELGQAGVYIHDQNRREMSRYLVEFIHENEPAIPHIDYVDRLGVCGEGLVLPGGQINLKAKYTGAAIQIGTDHDAYRRVLREVATWEHTTTIWGVLALALAGPVFARRRDGRNPVVMLAGASGSGKSTITHFVTGCYGNPTRSPLQIQCGSGTTTPKSIQQAIAILNGVPFHLEDVHMTMVRYKEYIPGLIYDFANGQMRSYGTLDQKGGGGQEIGGCLLMTGEMLPELQYEGSQRRLFLYNCMKNPPIGAPPRSNEGERRAHLLDSAWLAGAGTFGAQVCQTIWANWDAFARDAARFSADEGLKDLHAWRSILGTAAAVLQVAAGVAGFALDCTNLLRRWAALHAEEQRERDPAIEAFERVLTMLAQCETTDNSEVDASGAYRTSPSWRMLRYNRALVAAQRVGDPYWRVLTGSEQWLRMVGRSAVDQFGSAWLKANLILPQRDEKKRTVCSGKVYIGPERGSVQSILVPDSLFAPPAGESE